MQYHQKQKSVNRSWKQQCKDGNHQPHSGHCLISRTKCRGTESQVLTYLPGMDNRFFNFHVGALVHFTPSSDFLSGCHSWLQQSRLEYFTRCQTPCRSKCQQLSCFLSTTNTGPFSDNQAKCAYITKILLLLDHQPCILLRWPLWFAGDQCHQSVSTLVAKIIRFTHSLKIGRNNLRVSSHAS